MDIGASGCQEICDTVAPVPEFSFNSDKIKHGSMPDNKQIQKSFCGLWKYNINIPLKIGNFTKAVF